jgi:hypothetical protein
VLVKMILMDPLMFKKLVPFIDIGLIYPGLGAGLPEELQLKSVGWDSAPQEVVPRLAAAKIVFLHMNGFDTWTDILLSMAQKRPLAMRICIIAGSDYALADEQMEILYAFFPQTQFWIQNWCGSKSEAVRLLPIGVMGSPPKTISVSKTRVLAISYSKYYPTNEKRHEFYTCIQKNHILQQYFLQSSSYERYCEMLSESYFSTCPMGEGFDTFRFWESLMMGSIPIVKEHVFYDVVSEYYPKIPMVRLKEWDNLVTRLPELTKEYYDELWSQADISCLSLKSWCDILEQAAAHKN